VSNEALREISKHFAGANDPYLTGWNNWPHKQELYKIYWAAREALEQTATFAGEEEWLEEQRQERVLSILSR
jgi:hypothetical protein